MKWCENLPRAFKICVRPIYFQTQIKLKYLKWDSPKQPTNTACWSPLPWMKFAADEFLGVARLDMVMVCFIASRGVITHCHCGKHTTWPCMDNSGWAAYSTIICLQRTCKTYLMGHPHGQAMGCLLWVRDMIYFFAMPMLHFSGLVQERRNSNANALELSLSCSNPWISYRLQCIALTMMRHTLGYHRDIPGYHCLTLLWHESRDRPFRDAVGNTGF